MAEIRPFCGYRFALKTRDDLKKFVAPPYDMLSTEMVDDLYAKDDHNVVRITQCKSVPADAGNMDRHRRAARTFASWIEDGTLNRDTEPSLYVYKQTFTYDDAGVAKTVERTGVVALVKLVDFEEKIVLPHEATLSGPKQDRLDLLEATTSHTEQIFGLLDDNGDFYKTLRAVAAGDPDGVFEDSTGVLHQLYRCNDTAVIEKLTALAVDKTILIADGHHRYETALNFFKAKKDPAFDAIMMTLVSTADPGLVIRPFHRLIRKEGNRVEMRTALEEYFTLTETGAATPEHINAFISADDERVFVFQDSENKKMYDCALNENGKKYIESVFPGHSMQWKQLPVALINVVVINKILGLPLNGKVLHDTVEYVNDAAVGSQRCSDPSEWYGGFFIRPLSIETIGSVVTAGERMPQKSTNFYPKMYSGLVLHTMGR